MDNLSSNPHPYRSRDLCAFHNDGREIIRDFSVDDPMLEEMSLIDLRAHSFKLRVVARPIFTGGAGAGEFKGGS